MRLIITFVSPLGLATWNFLMLKARRYDTKFLLARSDISGTPRIVLENNTLHEFPLPCNGFRSASPTRLQQGHHLTQGVSIYLHIYW